MDKKDAIELAAAAKQLGLDKKAVEAADALAKPSLNQVGEILGDQLRYLRLKRALTILKNAQSKLADSGLEGVGINLKLLVPMLEAASLEDDEDIQEMWTNLLANAASEDSDLQVEPAYVDILRQLSDIDVWMMAFLHHRTKRGPTDDFWKHYGSGIPEAKSKLARGGVSEDQVDISVDNLIRLRLATFAPVKLPGVDEDSENPWAGPTAVQAHDGAGLFITQLGRSFMAACDPPTAPGEP